MARYYDDYDFGKFNPISISELKKNIEKSLANDKEYEPICVESSSRKKICTSWWGEAWCKNLERYADYDSRIGRGRSYVRNGAVIDLKIKGGKINARVQGSRSKPYKIKINIDALSEKQRIKIEKQASGKIQDLESLIYGNFPEDLKELFFQKGGLFPSPEEIHFDCTCPDWADMCKHVAAALYGVGVRLDSNPLYFFQMRGIDIESFVDKVVAGKVQSMLDNADKESPRILKDADLLQIFNLT